ncbi:AraC family transcriptional regulator [Pseudooceanicola sp. CBS1P-1]|uniref:Helix-turn-helix domain-containing protein n=1 Tax=Pseudooceanicola albus TaxID=2692189 RepID=A0A6L7G3I6_9RHOB|nr:MULTISPECIES: AraC family transcriptional regulator [Pseudooceanicola]MBT9385137.1 AraC family transcriptional regulator [Pseudooceanicola endophyticus]MXN18571.1 helix-turn-helix domain-containing protein [Pseudooceanicola albus]
MIPDDILRLASGLAPRPGYNPTALAEVRLLRSETVLEDVPVLYRPGVVFVLQGAKQGLLDGQVYRYDADHYLAVSVPVPFRMASRASAARPLLALYVEFDMVLAAEIAVALEGRAVAPARGLVSSPMDLRMRDLLRRLLQTLADPQESAILGPALLRELHYRVLVGPQGGALRAALRHRGTAGRIVRSLGRIRVQFASGLSVADLAAEAGMSVPSYHAHFKALTGTSPLRYIKAMRLHEARLMIARNHGPVTTIAAEVGYASAAQFSRDFRRHFGRSATEEARWMRLHLGEGA